MVEQDVFQLSNSQKDSSINPCHFFTPLEARILTALRCPKSDGVGVMIVTDMIMDTIIEQDPGTAVAQ